MDLPYLGIVEKKYLEAPQSYQVTRVRPHSPFSVYRAPFIDLGTTLGTLKFDFFTKKIQKKKIYDHVVPYTRIIAWY